MAVSMSVKIEGMDEVVRTLNKVSPSRNAAWVSRALLKCAFLTQEISAREKIKPGGKGPPLPNILTSRTGTLRRSIAVNRLPLPFAVDIGTDLTYGAIHESGWSGRQHIPSHTRTVAFGRKVAPFTVHSFTRTVHYPARPFLSPALNKASGRFSEFFATELGKELQ